MYDKHDPGIQSCPEKLGNLPICVVVTESQEDCLVSEAKFR